LRPKRKQTGLVMKKIPSFSFAAALAALLCGSVMTGCQKSLEDKCAEEAKVYTRKNCPMDLDENQRMDSMTFERNSHTICYYYTFKGIADDTARINERSEDMKEAMVKAYKNDMSMRLYKEKGYKSAYIFHSEKNPQEVLFSLTLSMEKNNVKVEK